MNFSVTSSTWPVTPSWSMSTTKAWAAPVKITMTTDGHYVAELAQGTNGIHGVGCSVADAIADLRAAIREFACVLGIVPCEEHKSS